MTPDLSMRVAGLSREDRLHLLAQVQDRLAEADEVSSIPHRTSSDSIPQSFAQQRLWFFDRLAPNTPAYNVPYATKLTGKLHIPVLEDALAGVIDRHAILRTTFAMIDGNPVQLICSAVPFSLRLIELNHLPAMHRLSEAHRLATAEARQPFDLARGPLLRVALLRLDAQEHVLLLTLHHIIFDAWSVQVFFRELAALYEAFSAGRPPPLPELPIQYADYAVWQRERSGNDVFKTQLAYWKRQLAGAPPVLALPTDRPRPPARSYRGAVHTFAFPTALTTALRRLSQREAVTLFMAVFAAFQVLLARYTGQDDIVIGIPVANRTQPETEDLIGFFVNTLALRTDLSGNPSFRELLGRVRKAALDAYSHQDLPFEQLVEALQPERDLSYTPLCQVVFQLREAPIVPATLGDLAVYVIPVETAAAKFDLSVNFEIVAEGLAGDITYDTDLFDANTIARLTGHLQTLLAGIVADPNRRLSELPLLTPTEQRQVLEEWNATAAQYPQDRCVHELFEAQVERTPDAVALVLDDQHLTYRELNARANQLAHHLRELTVGPEVLVGLCAERSLEMVIGLLGILKAGGAYVPLDLGYPSDRLAFMFADAQAPVLLTQERLVGRLPIQGARPLRLDADWEAIARHGTENLASGATAENLAYVIYTSGSTGRPKGTLIPHRGLVNYLSWCTQAYAVADGQGAPIHSSIAFDLTITGLFAPLLVGRTVHLLPDGHGVEALSKALRRRPGFSIVKITPAHLQLLRQQMPPQDAVGGARAFVIGGETLKAESTAFWQEVVPETALINEYGPTETVVGCCVYRVPPGRHTMGAIPIGRPIANTQLYVLDRYLQAVPIGVPGELYIGGDGLARGYLDRPGLTAERFVPHPFSTIPGARLYRTGDLARYLPTGDLECLGRIDNQVKIRGFRVELGEIEAILSAHPAVQQSVVVVREDAPGDRRLVAYVVSQPPQATSNELHCYVKERLPDYMVPSSVVLLDALPLTVHDKVDYQRLLASNLGIQPARGTACVAPRNAMERAVATTWQSILAIEMVGAHDNFFDLGGHSLSLLRVQSALAELIGRAVSVVDLFQYPTVSSLAQYLTQASEQRVSFRDATDRAAKKVQALQQRKRSRGVR